MLTHRIPPDLHGGIHLFIPPYAIGLVPSLSGHAITFTNGVHCRESAGTGPVVLKIVPATGAAFSGITMDQLIRATLFFHTHFWMPIPLVVSNRAEVNGARHGGTEPHFSIQTGIRNRDAILVGYNQQKINEKSHPRDDDALGIRNTASKSAASTSRILNIDYETTEKTV